MFSLSILALMYRSRAKLYRSPKELNYVPGSYHPDYCLEIMDIVLFRRSFLVVVQALTTCPVSVIKVDYAN